MNNNYGKNVPTTIAVLLFLTLSVWWLGLNLTKPEGDYPYLLFGATYGLMALFGGLYGLFTAKSWGGYKSALGRAILYLASGLLLAEFGQIVFSYYNIVSKVEIPYPSLADVGFFGSIPFYIFGAFALTKVLGVRNSLKSNPLKLILGMVLPLALLGVSYSFFLKGYDFTEQPRLNILLDFGYPLGQTIYVSLALVTLLSVGRMLGGAMKKPMLILLFAFLLQYAADFNFLYQTIHGTWINGHYGDYLYLLAYFVMTLSLININRAFRQTNSSASKGLEV